MSSFFDDGYRRPPVSGNSLYPGHCRVWGNPPQFDSTMTAECERGQVPVFSRSCTGAFRDAAIKFLKERGIIT